MVKMTPKRYAKLLAHDCKLLELPLPGHEYGFTDAQLKECLSASEYKAFWEWMYGQTMMLDKKLGPIAYTEDVVRGVKLIRFKTPTCFD